MGFINSVKSFFAGESAPGFEFYQAKKETDTTFTNFVFETYKDAFKNIEPHIPEWKENRRAYMARSVDQHNFKDAVWSDGGVPNVYCSTIVADKIEDQSSIQLSGRPMVYPLPLHSVQFNYAPYLKPNESPGDWVRNLWTASFRDLQERRGIQELHFKIAIESRLVGYCITKQTQEYDFDTKEQDIFVKICNPEDIGFDPDAKTWDDMRYIYHREWKTPYELITLYPKFKDEIMAGVGNSTADRKPSGEDRSTREKRNLVCVVEAYVKDLTQEETSQINSEQDPMTGQVCDMTVTSTRYKYPNGRRITFLDAGSSIEILKDESNPYKTFPFSIFIPKPVPWAVIGRVEATPLRALQYADDYVIQQMMKNVKRMGNSKIIYDRKGVQDPALLGSSDDVEKIPVDYLGAIDFRPPENVSMNAERVHALLQDAAQNISGIEAPSEGRAPGSITSGVGISLLQEGTNRKIRPVRDIYVEYLTRVWKQVADIMLDLYRAGRVLRVSDDDGLPVQLPVNLYDVTDSIDVVSDSDTALPHDPVSLANLAIAFLQIKDENGMPIADREFLAQWLKIPGLREAIDRINQKSQALAQQQMMMKQPQGGQPYPNQTDLPSQQPPVEMGSMPPADVQQQPGMGTLGMDGMAGFNALQN